MEIPQCYDPVYQEEQRQRQWDARQQRLAKCVCCNQPLELVLFVDLTPFGLKETLCEECFFRHSRWLEQTEEE